jgi:hypothetical protein
LKQFLAVICLIAGVALFGAAQYAVADEMRVLAPVDGYKSWSSSVWVIVENGSEVPTVRVDGAVVGQKPVSGGDGVYHFRVGDLKKDGSLLEIAHEDSVQKLTVYGPGSTLEGSDSFHTSDVVSCWQCHDNGNKSCSDCHTFGGHEHAGKIQCDSCHDEKGKVLDDIAPACVRCHRDYAGGRHPNLKHSIQSPNDPMRPGRKFDCVSCHDPHAPNCLGCLSKNELRKWCKDCHSQP